MEQEPEEDSGNSEEATPQGLSFRPYELPKDLVGGRVAVVLRPCLRNYGIDTEKFMVVARLKFVTLVKVKVELRQGRHTYHMRRKVNAVYYDVTSRSCFTRLCARVSDARPEEECSIRFYQLERPIVERLNPPPVEKIQVSEVPATEPKILDLDLDACMLRQTLENPLAGILAAGE